MRRQVLVIEDNPHDRELVEAFLDAVRYEVKTAERGGLGLSAAIARPPDVIVLDLRLPDLDGYEVCRQLRQEPQTRHIPIVIITASDEPALNRDAYAAGAQACLPKPFRKEALITMIEAVLSGRRRGRSPSGRGKHRSPPGKSEGSVKAWENLGPYRGCLIWVKRLEATCWTVALTPVPRPSEGLEPAGELLSEMVLPERFDSRETAEAAAKRYIIREHDRQVQREAREDGERADESDEPLGQRRFMRFPASLPVIGLAPKLDQGEILGLVRNVSAGGLMVEFPVELAPGNALGLVLLTQRGPLEVEAQIVWTAASGGTALHGLAFAQPKDRDFAAALSAEGSR